MSTAPPNSPVDSSFPTTGTPDCLSTPLIPPTLPSTTPTDTDLTTAITSILSSLGDTTGVEKVKTTLQSSYPNWDGITSKRVRVLMKSINTVEEEFGIEDRMGIGKEDVKRILKESGGDGSGGVQGGGGKKQRVKREKKAAKARATSSSSQPQTRRGRHPRDIPPFATRDNPYYRGENYEDSEEEEEEDFDSDDYEEYDEDEDDMEAFMQGYHAARGYFGARGGRGAGAGAAPMGLEDLMAFMAMREGSR